jgi:hypothetical protein
MNPMSVFQGATAVSNGAAGLHAAQAGAGVATANVAVAAGSRMLGALPDLHTAGATSKSESAAMSSHRSKRLGKKSGRPIQSNAHPATHKNSTRKPIIPEPVAAANDKVADVAAKATTTPNIPEAPSIASPPAAAKPAGLALPGLSAPVSKAVMTPTAAPSSNVPAVDRESSAAPRSADPWAARQNEAIKIVVSKTLPGTKITVGSQAKSMLKQMHEKELMHAAETGERLYLPDKMGWAALQEEGPRYRVYLNFMAMQANGERVQARSYQFIVDLKTHSMHADDTVTEQDLLKENVELSFKHNPMATDIDSLLGGVDTYNKHKVQMIIVKNSRSNREERTKIETALKNAQSRILRSIVYFRRTYADKALQNVAHAYNFVELVSAK